MGIIESGLNKNTRKTVAIQKGFSLFLKVTIIQNTIKYISKRSGQINFFA